MENIPKKDILGAYICINAHENLHKHDDEFWREPENRACFDDERKLYKSLLASAPPRQRIKIRRYYDVMMQLMHLMTQHHYHRGLRDCYDMALFLYEGEEKAQNQMDGFAAQRDDPPILPERE